MSKFSVHVVGTEYLWCIVREEAPLLGEGQMTLLQVALNNELNYWPNGLYWTPNPNQC